MIADTIDELIQDAHSYGSQISYGVVCDTPGYALWWETSCDVRHRAEIRCQRLSERHPMASFRVVRIVVSVKVEAV